MNRYATLTEEIQRYNEIADITRAKPPCDCEKQDQDLIVSANMDESEQNVAAQRDRFFDEFENEASRLDETGAAPEPQRWNDAVNLYNKIKNR